MAPPCGGRQPRRAGGALLSGPDADHPGAVRGGGDGHSPRAGTRSPFPATPTGPSARCWRRSASRRNWPRWPSGGYKRVPTTRQPPTSPRPGPASRYRRARRTITCEKRSTVSRGNSMRPWSIWNTGPFMWKLRCTPSAGNAEAGSGDPGRGLRNRPVRPAPAAAGEATGRRGPFPVGCSTRHHGRSVYDDLIEAELTAYLQTSPLAFDAIVAADTLVYFGDLAPVIAVAANALRRHGILAFTLEHLDTPPGRRRNSGLNRTDATAIRSRMSGGSCRHTASRFVLLNRLNCGERATGM